MPAQKVPDGRPNNNNNNNSGRSSSSSSWQATHLERICIGRQSETVRLIDLESGELLPASQRLGGPLVANRLVGVANSCPLLLLRSGSFACRPAWPAFSASSKPSRNGDGSWWINMARRPIKLGIEFDDDDEPQSRARWWPLASLLQAKRAGKRRTETITRPLFERKQACTC